MLLKSDRLTKDYIMIKNVYSEEVKYREIWKTILRQFTEETVAQAVEMTRQCSTAYCCYCHIPWNAYDFTMLWYSLGQVVALGLKITGLWRVVWQNHEKLNVSAGPHEINICKLYWNVNSIFIDKSIQLDLFRYA
jgi:hypothetical protein